MDLAAAGANLVDEAVRAVGRGDRGAARSLLLRASEVAPTYDLVWLWLAQISSSPADKASYLRRVLELYPGHEVARAGLAEALREEGIAAAKTGARRRARSLLQSSIDLDRNREDSWLWLSAVAETEDERRRYLERVLEIDPGHRQALTLLALLERGGAAFLPGASGEELPAEPPLPTHADPGDPIRREGILHGLADLDGFLGACLVDSRSGSLLSSEGGGQGLDVEAAAVGDAEVVRAQATAMATLGLNDVVEDILINLGTQYHLIRPLGAREGLFLHLMLDKGLSNLALARLRLAGTERDLSV